MKIALLAVEAILGIIIAVSILLQPSKADALSGLIQGKSETFYSKNKGRTKEVLLVRVTAISAALFAINTVILNII
ncbi:preprotein translocase subunit SecG [Inconstantimicrobium mannanitabidum]|uniref:Preprotein translocase, SecG subunit n=1 Tax=Inconstantimicrobium mannanitabidum TaxID=1604901 RepID=A0ACB5REL6_9CLOT|nr:preprotein translocase subunit SecG [Clostridium sp. TW13]GKX67702.1 preprotein translocase, SecG subunit [Clostridium sp. TW13]